MAQLNSFVPEMSVKVKKGKKKNEPPAVGSNLQLSVLKKKTGKKRKRKKHYNFSPGTLLRDFETSRGTA